MLGDILKSGKTTGKTTAAIAITIDEFPKIKQQYGIALGEVRRADLEVLIQLSARLQTTIAEPISVDATRVFYYRLGGVLLCKPNAETIRTSPTGFSRKGLGNCAGKWRWFNSSRRPRR